MSQLANHGLAFSEHDALIQANGRCFVEFEDLSPPSCFVSNSSEMLPGNEAEVENGVTPHACQQECKSKKALYYGVLSSSRCRCTVDSFFALLEDSLNCTEPCAGDPFQARRGTKSLLVGSSHQLSSEGGD